MRELSCVVRFLCRLLTGQVDERTIQKYEKEAKEKNRESWYIAYIMDTNDEERDRVCTHVPVCESDCVCLCVSGS